MKASTVYSKTARGLTEARKGAKNLPPDHARVLMLIDGKSSIADFMAAHPELSEPRFAAILESLAGMGLIRALANFASDPDFESLLDARPAGGSVPAAIEVTELSPQDSVQAWAAARRGARLLEERGFFTYGAKPMPPAGAHRKAWQALVVEDDEMLAQMLELLLSEKGFATRKAADIPAALAALADGPAPDLVLLDVVLPGLPGHDGFHVLRHVRERVPLRKVPVIMVTSKISDEYVMRGLKAGADGYIFKPFELETLFKAVNSVTGL